MTSRQSHVKALPLFFFFLSVTDSCKMPKYCNSFFFPVIVIILSHMCHIMDQVLNNVKYMSYKARILLLTNTFGPNSSPAEFFTPNCIWELNVLAQSISFSVCLVLALFLVLASCVSSCLMGSVWWLCWAFRELAAQRDSRMGLAQQGIDFDILSVTTTSLLHGCQQRWH